MKPRIILSALIIPLGLIIASVPDYKISSARSNPEIILSEVRSGAHLITTDEVAEIIINKDPSFQLIDVRNPDEFEKFNLPGSINIPIDNILSSEWVAIFELQSGTNVLYSNGTTKANEAWIILRHKGYINNNVMQGGLNHWAETIMNPIPPANLSPDDEIAKYNFRRGAGQALGGGVLSVDTGSVDAPAKPVIKKTDKKKRAAGGC